MLTMEIICNWLAEEEMALIQVARIETKKFSGHFLRICEWPDPIPIGTPSSNDFLLIPAPVCPSNIPSSSLSGRQGTSGGLHEGCVSAKIPTTNRESTNSTTRLINLISAYNTPILLLNCFKLN